MSHPSTPPHTPRPPSPALVSKRRVAAAPPSSEPCDADLAVHESFGEVDPDGTVWVTTPEGRQHVGSYPDATPEQALRFYARKYADLMAQLHLLHTRVTTGKLSPSQAQTTRDKLREEIAQARVVGDLTALTHLLETVTAAIDAQREQLKAQRAQARQAASQAKLELVEKAEALATSNAWKVGGQRFRDMVEQWKTLPRLDKSEDDQLWKRFSAARTAFDRSRRSHFAELDSQREQAGRDKEKLVQQAEALATSRQWAQTSGQFRELMTAWKSAGRAARGDDEALWERMKAAQDTFFSARNAVYAEREADQQANVEKKKALAQEADKLLPIKDLAATKTALRALQERWDAAGEVPRDQRDKLEQRLRAVEKAVREADHAQWNQSNPQRRARASAATVSLRESIDTLTTQAEAARAAGDHATAQNLAEQAQAKQQWLEQVEKYV